MRDIYLDLETTGLSAQLGDRIVEIGAAESVNGQLTGRTFHAYLNPQHPMHPDAFAVHGLSDDFLRDKSHFESLRQRLEIFLSDARLFIHNAHFDVPFLEAELARTDGKPLRSLVDSLYDTLPMFRGLFPGQRCDLASLRLRLAVPAEAIAPTTIVNATLLARLCGRVHTVMALAHPQSHDEEMNRFLDLARSIEAMPELPEEFGIAYLQRHLKLNYRFAIRLMNLMCRMGLGEWAVDEQGELTLQRPSSISATRCPK